MYEVAGGRYYELNDMVRVGCHDCQGCSDCCKGMGDSILLDPYDVNLLSKNLGKSFQELLSREIELSVKDGLILPNIAMNRDVTGEEKCSFLNEKGRCSVHGFRPGICRLFPLGRNYTPDHLNYFLLEDACPKENKTKMKISKWLGTENIKNYHKYLLDWHNMVKQFRGELASYQDESQVKQMTSLFLNLFYGKAYGDDFYGEFYERMKMIGAY